MPDNSRPTPAPAEPGARTGTASPVTPAVTPVPPPAPAAAQAIKPVTAAAMPGGPAVTAPVQGPLPELAPWGRGWPGPARAASPATVWSLVAAAIVAAAAVPPTRGGAGWLVAAVAGVAALILARAVPEKLPVTVPPPLFMRPALRPGPARYVWTAATLTLLSVGTLRAAGWLFLLCLAAAGLTTALAVTGGRSARGIVVSVFLPVGAMFRALPWVSDGLRSARWGASGARVTATIAASAVLLLVFGALFASADPAFARIVDGVIPAVDVPTAIRWTFVFVLAGGVLGGLAFLRAAPPTRHVPAGSGGRRLARLEWLLPLSLLTLLFAMFVGVQLTVLFGGARHVLETEGLTYAEYARGGFWQLLVITVLTLVVLAGVARWAPRESRADRVLIRLVPGALTLLTLVVVGSSLHRMVLYADTYGLTRLRVLVFLCEVWLGVVFLLVLVAGVRLRAAWLPRAVVATGVLALLGLAAADPDRLIAERNVARFEQTGTIDAAYLSTLSADAVPALLRLPSPQQACALGPIANRLNLDDHDWRGWNLARERARDLVAGGTTVGC